MTEQHIDEANIPGQEYGERTVGTSDELAKQLVAEQKERIQKELDQYIAQKDMKEKLLKRHEVQWADEDARWQLMLDNYERINPEWKFETNPEYIRLNNKIHRYQYESQKEQAEQWQEGTRNEIKELDKRIAKQKEELKKVLSAENGCDEE